MIASVRGLYGIADAAAAAGDPESLAADLLRGGCRLVQLRCKGWAEDDTLAVARAIRARCTAHGAVFLVNDHAEVAARAQADGVHLGQLDGATHEARRILGPDRIIGRSTNRLDQIAETLPGVDYLAFGPVFPSTNLSRPKPVQGLELLTRARQAIPDVIPLVAIGGIDASHIPEVREAGAQAWAVISAVAGRPDRIAATRHLLSV